MPNLKWFNWTSHNAPYFAILQYPHAGGVNSGEHNGMVGKWYDGGDNVASTLYYTLNNIMITYDNRWSDLGVPWLGGG